MDSPPCSPPFIAPLGRAGPAPRYFFQRRGTAESCSQTPEADTPPGRTLAPRGSKGKARGPTKRNRPPGGGRFRRSAQPGGYVRCFLLVQLVLDERGWEPSFVEQLG